jgi:hypothetical protein
MAQQNRSVNASETTEATQGLPFTVTMPADVAELTLAEQQAAATMPSDPTRDTLESSPPPPVQSRHDGAGMSDVRSSLRGSSANPISVKTAKDSARELVRMAATGVHVAIAQDAPAQSVGLGLADEADVAAIGDPLGSIAHRRAGLAAIAGNPDAIDALMCLIGLAVYVSKQVRRWSEVRALRAVLAAEQAATPPPPDEVPTAGPVEGA